MAKALRVLVVLLLVASGAALYYANQLFDQREQLKGRAHELEEKIVEIGTTLEAERPTVETKPQYPARDTDECTADLVDSPAKSDFWNSYAPELEVLEVPTLNLAKRTEELKSFYQRNEVDGSINHDPQGVKITTGDRTMDKLLKETVRKAEDQLTLLNETRIMLSKVRKELVDTVTEMNSRKKKLRDSMATIVQRDQTIASLEGKIRDLEGNISTLEGNVRTLRDTIAEQKTQIEQKDEQIQGNKDEIARLKVELEKLKPRERGLSEQYLIARGLKGTVEKVNASWNFVVLKVTPAFIAELTTDPNLPLPEPTLIIKRKGADHQTYVAKVRLIRLRKDEQLAVADVLTDWQQQPIQEGDEVYF